jgi:hypothetical protein
MAHRLSPLGFFGAINLQKDVNGYGRIATAMRRFPLILTRADRRMLCPDINGRGRPVRNQLIGLALIAEGAFFAFCGARRFRLSGRYEAALVS